MSALRFASLLRRSLVAAAVGLACPVSGFGSDRAASPELQVEIFSDHYVAGGERVTSLDALEARVRASNARTVRPRCLRAKFQAAPCGRPAAQSGASDGLRDSRVGWGPGLRRRPGRACDSAARDGPARGRLRLSRDRPIRTEQDAVIA